MEHERRFLRKESDVILKRNLMKVILVMLLLLSTVEANAASRKWVKAQSHIAAHEQQKGEKIWKKFKKEQQRKAAEQQKEADILLLARIIANEAGADYLSTELSYYVGSVVVNRVNSDLFPNTYAEVAYQPGQYSPVGSPAWYEYPNERSLKVARDLYENGSVLPENVVWQANFKQGKGVYIYQEGMYFCY